MEDLPFPGKKREKNKEEELSGTARSLLSCARSQKCHWVIEWGSAGSCKSGKRRFTSICRGKVNRSFFMRLVLCSEGKRSRNVHVYFFSFSKNMHGGSDGEEDKGGSLSAGAAASPANPCCFARRQRKALSQESKCRSECFGEEVNSCYSPITWRHRTADGRAFYIGGASLSHQCLVTTNPAATSDSFLSFSTLSLFLSASQPLCLFWRGHQPTTMSLWGPTCPWPSSSAACVCVCLSVCAHE